MKYIKEYIFTLTGGHSPQILGTQSEDFNYLYNSQQRGQY